jgi:predicted ATP-dependent endonuclease of OLD family
MQVCQIINFIEKNALWEESMNIYKIKIINYKSIKDSGEVEIDDKIMAFIGQNNAGKSAILDAIQCVFPSSKKVVNRSDFHKGTQDNIESCISLTA